MKKIIALVLCLLMLVSLVACADTGAKTDKDKDTEISDKQDPKPSDPEPSEPEVPETIRYYLVEMAMMGQILSAEDLGMAGSYVEMNKDGTGSFCALQLGTESITELTYADGKMQELDEDGELITEYEYEVDGAELLLTAEQEGISVTMILNSEAVPEKKPEQKPEVSDPAEFTPGRYAMTGASVAGFTMSVEDLGMGGSYIDLNADGTGVFCLVSEGEEETADISIDNGKMSVVADGETDVCTYTLQGKTLTLEIEGMQMIFELGAQTVTVDAQELSGRYYLTGVDMQGVQMTAAACGMDGTYVELNKDGTGMFYVVSEDESFSCDVTYADGLMQEYMNGIHTGDYTYTQEGSTLTIRQEAEGLILDMIFEAA